MSAERPGTGTVYIVGAGPGDEGLITVRGSEALSKADAVVYDFLINDKLLKNCPMGCELICVGKAAGRHSMPQEKINAMLVELALKGKTVVRLKGGDPFIFGRGSEEALELARNGIRFVIVPGVTAASAAAAYAGIPLTHRGVASSVALITGHEDPMKEQSDVNWERLSAGAGTLAVYMGVKNLEKITGLLVRGGRSLKTPAALIRWGTMNSQQTLVGNLSDIAELARVEGFEPPAVLVVGEVAALREKLRWFDNRPLFGRKILVTRSRSQASELSWGLRKLGADVREFPTIEIKPLEDLKELERLIEQTAAFDWIVFTSVNAADIFFDRLGQMGRDARALSGVRVAAIGAGTYQRIKEHGIRADLVPESYTSDAMLEAFKKISTELRGKRFLFPCSEIAREVLPEGLEHMGAEVTCLPIYRNFVPQYSGESVDAMFAEKPELVTFTSSSTVTNFVEILRACGRLHYLKDMRGACIGPVTAKTAEQKGIEVALESDVHTIEGLIAAIDEYFRIKGTRR